MNRPLRRLRCRLTSTWRTSDGFTVLEVTVAMALFSIIMIGIVAMQASALRTVSLSRDRTQATELANQEIERIRSLRFRDIGVTGGNPPGVLPSTRSVTVGPQTYTINYAVIWVDDESDKLATDSISPDADPEDYKQVDVEITWPNNPRVTRLRTFVHPITVNSELHQPPQVLILRPSVDGTTFTGSRRTFGIATSPNRAPANRIIEVQVDVEAPDGTIYFIGVDTDGVGPGSCGLPVALTMCEVSPSASAETYFYEITATVDTLSLPSNGGAALPDLKAPYTLRYIVFDNGGRDNTDERSFFVDNTPPTAPPVITSITSDATPAVYVDWAKAEDDTGIREYRIFRRRVPPGEPLPPAGPPFTQVAQITVTDQVQASYTYQDNSVLLNDRYEYFVRAVDFAQPPNVPPPAEPAPCYGPPSDTCAGPYVDSNFVGINTPVGPCVAAPVVDPQFPLGAAATATFVAAQGEVIVSWSPPAEDANCDFANPVSPPAGYYVERQQFVGNKQCPNAEPDPFVPLTNAASPAPASSRPSEVEYHDRSFENNKRYCYRVFPRDGAGNTGAPLYAPRVIT